MGNGTSQTDLITINNTSVKIADRDATRKSIYLYNASTGGQTITIVFSNNKQAEALHGVVLGPAVNFIDCDSEGYECWEGQIHAISSAADGKLAIYIR